MASHTINISASQPNDAHPDKSTLTLSDSGETSVKPGDTVTWTCSAPGVTSFLVLDDNKNADVFSPDPAPGSQAGTWVGTVNDKLKNKAEETYLICWSQGGKVYCYDPKITVNP